MKNILLAILTITCLAVNAQDTVRRKLTPAQQRIQQNALIAVNGAGEAYRRLDSINKSMRVITSSNRILSSLLKRNTAKLDSVKHVADSTLTSSKNQDKARIASEAKADSLRKVADEAIAAKNLKEQKENYEKRFFNWALCGLLISLIIFIYRNLNHTRKLANKLQSHA